MLNEKIIYIYVADNNYIDNDCFLEVHTLIRDRLIKTDVLLSVNSNKSFIIYLDIETPL